MAKKDFADIGDGSRIYMEEARGKANQAGAPRVKAGTGAAPAGSPEFRYIGKYTPRVDGRKIGRASCRERVSSVV